MSKPDQTATRTPEARHNPPRTNDRGAALTAAVVGPLFFLLGLVQPPQGPAVGVATAAQIRAFTIEHDTAIRVGAAIGVLGALAVLMFTAALARLIRDVSPNSMLASLVTGAGVLLTGVYLLNTAALAMTALLPGLIDVDLATVDDATLRGWYALTGFTHLLGDLQMAPIAFGHGRLLRRRAARTAAAPLAVLARPGLRHLRRSGYQRHCQRLGTALPAVVRWAVRLGPMEPDDRHHACAALARRPPCRPPHSRIGVDVESPAVPAAQTRAPSSSEAPSTWDGASPS
jgi:hypothetical protein